MRISEFLTFDSFVLGRSLDSSLEDVVASPRFRELLDGFGEEGPVEPVRVGLRDFAVRSDVSAPVGSSPVPPLSSGGFGGFTLRSSPEPEVLDVASQRAARFGRSVSGSDLDVAGAGR